MANETRIDATVTTANGNQFVEQSIARIWFEAKRDTFFWKKEREKKKNKNSVNNPEPSSTEQQALQASNDETENTRTLFNREEVKEHGPSQSINTYL